MLKNCFPIKNGINGYYNVNKIVLWLILSSPLPSHSIYTDHNEDNTSVILQEWVTNTQHSNIYHSIQYNHQTQWTYDNKKPFEWHYERLEHICKLRQRAMEDARALRADYTLVSTNIANYCS